MGSQTKTYTRFSLSQIDKFVNVWGFRTQGIEWRCRKIHKMPNTKRKELIFSKNICGTALMLFSYSLFNLEAIPPLPESI